MASRATQNIDLLGSFGGAQRNSAFVVDPATGALVVRPDLRPKVTKAIMAEVRRIKRRLIYRKLVLKTSLLFLKARYAAVNAVGNLYGGLLNLIRNWHRLLR